MTRLEDENIVMYDSPEAAIRVDMPGWKSRLGHFYPGDNASSEHGARWSGCTHMTCECGNVYEKGRVRCDSCQAKIDSDKYYALPVADWDEVTPVCSYGDDRYFFDKDAVMDFMFDLLEEAKGKDYDPEVQLVLCDPTYLHTLDTDNWADELPEDGDLPDAVSVALDAFNAALKAEGPSCWFPGKQRIDVDALWKELKEDLAKEKETAEWETANQNLNRFSS